MATRGEAQMEGVENNPGDAVSVVMLAELREELEALKRRNYEEIKILKFQNEYMKQRLKADETIPITTSLEIVESSKHIH